MHLLAEVAMGREAGLLHHVTQGHLAPAPAAFWCGQRVDQLAGLGGVAQQAFADGFDLFRQQRLVLGTNLFKVVDAFLEGVEILADRLHQLFQLALRAFPVALERLVGALKECGIGALQNALRQLGKLGFFFCASGARLGQGNLGLTGDFLLRLQGLLRVGQVFFSPLQVTADEGGTASQRPRENAHANRGHQEEYMNGIKADRADNNKRCHSDILPRFSWNISRTNTAVTPHPQPIRLSRWRLRQRGH